MNQKRPSVARLAIALVAFVSGCSRGSGPEKPREESHEGGQEERRHDHEPGKDEHGHEEGHHDHEPGKDEHGHEEHEEGVVELTSQAMTGAKIRVAPVEEREIPFVLRTTARVDFDERRLAHVSPRVPGRVHAVHAELGDDVEVGHVLAMLDSIELGETKATYLAAKAEESLARKTLEREERLLAEKITSEQAVIEARAGHEKALAQLRSAEEKLRLLGLPKEQIGKARYGDPDASLYPLLAPIAGRIVEKHLVTGELVSPEDKVFTVGDLSRLWIWIDVYERDLSRVHRDDTAAVVVQAHPGRSFEGHVAYIRDEVDPHTRAARARIDIDNPDGALKPGMFAEVTLTDPHGKDGGAAGRKSLAVPATAVQRDGEKDIAFVQEGERRFRRRELRVGSRTDEFVEVLDGLAAGEKVVVEGAFLLKSEAAKESMGEGHSH